MVVVLVAPLSQADVSDFSRRDYGVCRCCTKIAARLVDDSAMRVGHFASRRVVSLVLDDLFEDLGVAEAYHDVVWLEVGVDDMTFNVHVVQALE
jgi:hypothetical protein